MPLSTLIFLGFIIAAFSFFGVLLFSVHIWVNLPEKPKSNRIS